MSEVSVPNRNALINPVLRAVHDLGGSGTIQEIHDKVVSNLQLSDEQVAKPIKSGASGPTQLAHRLGWARSDLKAIGLLINSARGVWSLTEKGKSTSEVDGNEVRRAVNEIIKQEKLQRSDEESTVGHDDDEDLTKIDESRSDEKWRDALYSVLTEMDPIAFERLCQRILRESGFTQVEVTGRSGDGGLDGIGVMRIGGFLSFKVLFQCKRYKGSIGASVIRDFRGAMVGRTEGLIVTTGSFTPAATREATRDGAPEIDLVDGEQLVEKLKELELGVRTEQVTVERVVIDREWFGGV